MGFSKTIYSIIGVLVAVIMIATVAMPAITSASTTTTTTTTTEIQDVNVSDPIYYEEAGRRYIQVQYSQEGVISISQNYGVVGYTISGDFVSIPLMISDTIVSILYKDGNTCYISSCGYDIDGDDFITHQVTLDAAHKFEIQAVGPYVQIAYIETDVGTTNYTFGMPSWHYIMSIPQNGGTYVTSLSQETVTLGSLNEVIAGSSYYVGYNSGDFAYIRNGEQTQYGDYALTINSVQTDAGNVDVSLKASYGDTEVLILVPTTTEVNVIQTITVQSEYGPILNVVLLMLLIVPVTAVAAMLYTRRD